MTSSTGAFLIASVMQFVQRQTCLRASLRDTLCVGSSGIRLGLPCCVVLISRSTETARCGGS